MALRAGYYGLKGRIARKLQDEFEKLDGIIPAGVSISNPLASSADVLDVYKVLSSMNAINLLSYDLTYVKSKNTSGVWSDNSYAISGLTITMNSDNTFTVTGTASADVSFQVISRTSNPYRIKPGKYKLTGCPSGGGSSSYLLRGNETINSVAVQHNDRGDGVEFTVAEENNFGVFIIVSKDFVMGTGDDAKVFKPMLWNTVEKTDLKPDYAPHTMSNAELTDSASDQKAAINTIISAATGAADFAAFKTAMSAITPLTRSIPSGSDQRSLQDITPEDVPEEVIEEPVTKKRTTKKTVKEGE